MWVVEDTDPYDAETKVCVVGAGVLDGPFSIVAKRLHHYSVFSLHYNVIQ